MMYLNPVHDEDRYQKQRADDRRSQFSAIAGRSRTYARNQSQRRRQGVRYKGCNHEYQWKRHDVDFTTIRYGPQGLVSPGRLDIDQDQVNYEGFSHVC